MWSALADAFSNILDMFSEVFTMVTSADVIPWIILGIAVPVISFCVGLFKRIVWGKN